MLNGLRRGGAVWSARRGVLDEVIENGHETDASLTVEGDSGGGDAA